jgi:hypothetical protein
MNGGRDLAPLRLQESGDASQRLDDRTVLPIFALVIVQDVFGQRFSEFR